MNCLLFAVDDINALLQVVIVHLAARDVIDILAGLISNNVPDARRLVIHEDGDV